MSLFEHSLTLSSIKIEILLNQENHKNNLYVSSIFIALNSLIRFIAFSATDFAPIRTNGTPFPGRLLAPTNKTLFISRHSADGRVKLS